MPIQPNFKGAKFISKFNQGDEGAFLEMHSHYAPKIFRHAYYRLNSKETAQDIAQQVFFKVWEYIAGSDNKIDNINAFIYRTTNNLIADYYRKAERKNIALDDADEKKFATEPSYINEVDKNFEMAKVKKAILKLDPSQQQLIVWRYIDDLPISQIAKISGKSINAIYVGLHRALKHLKIIL